MTPLVRVLIPSYNRLDALLRCLQSVLDAGLQQGDVLVVDDASQDGSVAGVQRRYPACEVLVNDANQGFARTCNRGLAHLRARGAELVLLLNQDTVVAPDMPAILVRFMEQRPRAGMVGPKTYSTHPMPDGRPRLIHAGSWQGWLPLQQRIPGIGRAESAPCHDAVPSDYVWGHGMLLRLAAVEQVGPFDPAFPMYYEDLDLCRRMRAAGHEIWCHRGAVMWHDQPDGARAVHSEYWRWACKVRSTGVFHRKHHGRLRAPLLTALTIAADLKQLVGQGHVRAARHLLVAATRHALRLPDPLRGPGPLDAASPEPVEAPG